MLVSISGVPILFHATSFANVAKILKSNSFDLKPSEGVDAEEAHGNANYLSTTRHRLGAYHLNKGSGTALLTLDGDALSNRYKSASLDYWGSDAYGTEQQRADRFEAEERIYSAKPIIHNATKFILRIDFLFEGEVVGDNRDVIHIRNAYRIAKRLKIPIYVFTNKKDWIASNRSKCIPLSQFNVKDTTKKYKERAFTEDVLHKYVELWYQPINRVVNLTKPARDLIPNLRSRFYQDGEVRVLRADMHTARSQPRDVFNSPRKSLDAIVKIMRQNGLTAEDFIKTLGSKWESVNL